MNPVDQIFLYIFYGFFIWFAVGVFWAVMVGRVMNSYYWGYHESWEGVYLGCTTLAGFLGFLWWVRAKKMYAELQVNPPWWHPARDYLDQSTGR